METLSLIRFIIKWCVLLGKREKDFFIVYMSIRVDE